MGFYDDPIIDQYSKASEESVLKTRMFFSQKNNFISREEHPDKGVDLDVEIIKNNTATGFKFAIQIKSSYNFKELELNNTLHLKYSIKTSRLGYLSRRLPGLGLIILYDDKNSLIYFDYIENIYQKIMDVKRSNDWKNNEEVTFYINKNNQLSEDNIANIYSVFEERSKNTNDMYNEQSSGYNIPFIKTQSFQDNYEILKMHGVDLYNQENYENLLNLFSSIDLDQIISEKKLLLIATLTYFETANYVEYSFYYRKCIESINNYSKKEQDLISYTNLNSRLIFGFEQKSNYKDDLENFSRNITNQDIKFQVYVRLFYYKLHDLIKENKKDEILREISIIETIYNEELSSKDQSLYYKIQISSLYQNMGLQLMSKNFTSMNMLNNSGYYVSIEQEVELIQEFMNYIIRAREILEDIYQKANKLSWNGLIAQTLDSICLNFIMINTNILGLANQKLNDQFDRDAFNQECISNFNNALYAYNIFIKQHSFLNAFKSLSKAIEINDLYFFVNNNDIDSIQIKEINKKILNLEKDKGFAGFTNIVRQLLFSKEEKVDFKDMSDSEIEKYAKTYANCMHLPKERIKNIIFDFSSIREFETNCDKKYFEILQDLKHTQSTLTLYKERPKYVIRCKRCSYETHEDSNVSILIEELNLNHGYICM